MNLSQDIREYLEDFGGPEKSNRFSFDEIAAIEGLFPLDLRDFLTEYGRCLLEGGLIQLGHPANFRGVLALIFGADEEFSHNNCQVYAHSSFGKLFAWHLNYGFTSIDIVSGSIISPMLTKGIKKSEGFNRMFIAPFGSDNDFYDVEGKPLFKRAVKKLGPLEIGECYGFFPALALGGSPELEYLKRVSAPEHFAIVAQTMEFNLIDVQGYGNSVVVRPVG
jgi:hypothetical protein